MEQSTLISAGGRVQASSISGSRWQRIILLIVLAYEAAGCLLGGGFLIAAPDGSLMDLPLRILHGVFHDFLIPGYILLSLGVLNAAAFIEVILHKRAGWVLAFLALGGLVIWFIVEIAIVKELVWLHFMWGLPVYLGILMAIPIIPSQNIVQKALLICGIASSALYVLMNILVPLQWPGYNSASLTVSELSAIGAPTRPLWVWLGFIYNLLVIGFGWGIWKTANGNRALRTVGGLMIGYAIFGFFGPPMHSREVIGAGGGTLTDTLHITWAIVVTLIYLLTLSFGAAALGRSFRLFSLATLALLLVFGGLTFLAAEGISTNQPTPLVGVWERINIGLFMFWIVMLSVVLLKKEKIKS